MKMIIKTEHHTMSRLAGCCQFCEVHQKGDDKCPSRCDEKVEDELSLLNVDDYFRPGIHSLIRECTNDKCGTNWKYDMCDFCKKNSSLEKTLTIDYTTYNFCSSNCMIATMGRIYKLAIEGRKDDK